MQTQDHDSTQTTPTPPDITEDAWIDLMAELDRLAAPARGIDRRAHPRFRYAQTVFAACEVEHRSGRWVRSVVRTRDLSASGMSFFHGQYLNAGLNCRVTLQAHDHSTHQAAATVRRCDPVDDATYIVGIAFDEWIDPQRFTAHTNPATQTPLQTT